MSEDKKYVVKMEHDGYSAIYAHPDGPPTTQRDQALQMSEKDAQNVAKIWLEFFSKKGEGVRVISEEA